MKTIRDNNRGLIWPATTGKENYNKKDCHSQVDEGWERVEIVILENTEIKSGET